MALNLNKGKASNPSTEKKGLNLSKSGDTGNVKSNLTNDNVVIHHSESSTTKTDVKQKSPALFIIGAVVLLGIGGFFFMNNKENVPVVPVNVENSTSIREETVEPVPTLKDQETTSLIEADEQLTTTNKMNDNQETTSVNANSSNTSKVNNTITSTPASTQLEGTIEEKGRQVISGKFGNGADRKRALGAEYAVIQAKVNEMYKNGLNN